jgi:signal transduction histidine kinase/CheY-like chemotaxis protein
VIVPLVIGWLRLKGQQAGYFDTEFGIALFALTNIIILALLVWWNAEQVDEADARRRAIEADRDDLLAREQAARQRAETAVTARDQFLSIVSHELRTPLTPVLLIVTALRRRGDLPADALEDIASIEDQIQIEARLIDDLLDLARLGQGKMALEPVACDLNEVAAGVAGPFARVFAEKGVELKTDLRAAPSRVRVDPQRLAQVLRNLLENALKFTPAGGTVRMSSSSGDECAQAAGDGNGIGNGAVPARVCLTITDSGIGLPAGQIDRIFDPFEQGDPSTTRKFSGMGIGLTISRLLTELQGGTLRASSAGANQGSAFTVSFPLLAEAPTAAAAPVQAAPTSTAQSAAAPAASRRILIVEDNADTLHALRRLLQSHGHRVYEANSAQQALDVIDAEPIDLLISDIGLPDVSGWELMRQLRENHPDVRGIALSGFVTDEDRRRSLESGFVEHLSKPIELSRLLAAVEAAFAEPAPAPDFTRAT